MKIRALACDYDETIAPRGRIDESLLPQLARLQALGCKLILVTGRELENLRVIFQHLSAFDLVVAENGAVLYDPSNEKIDLLVEPPSSAFLDRLREKGIPFSTGHVIVSTRQPHEVEALEAIRDLGVEMHLIFNKGAVMVLPTSTNKAMGLKVALKKLDLSKHNLASIGDAENDHSLIDYAGVGVAVANSVESLKKRADIVTVGESARGVAELVSMITDAESSIHRMCPIRHQVELVGKIQKAIIDPSQGPIVVLASRGRDRDNVVMLLAQSLTKGGYQWCLLNFGGSAPSVPVGGCATLDEKKGAFSPSELASQLVNPHQNLFLTINLETYSKDQVEEVCSYLKEFIVSRGRPHFLILNEPEQAIARGISLDRLTDFGTSSYVLLTGGTSIIHASNRVRFNTILASGKSGIEALRELSSNNDGSVMKLPEVPDGPNSMLLLKPGLATPLVITIEEEAVTGVKVKPSLDALLDQSRQFCFTGPKNNLSLSTPTIRQFLEIGAGIDTETWTYHFRKCDYSDWIARRLGLPELAAAVEKLEKNEAFAANEARAHLEKMVTNYLIT